jgi:hypothetical protein
MTDRRRYRGQEQVNPVVTPDWLARALGESIQNVTTCLWQLQKAQAITFRERKGPKGNTIDRIRVNSGATVIAEIVGEVKEQRQVSQVTAEYPTAEAVTTYTSTTCKNRVAAPSWCVEHDSRWPRGDLYCEAEWTRHTPATEADDHDDEVWTSDGMAESENQPPQMPKVEAPALTDYPAIVTLLDAQRKRAVIEDVADRLMTAGLDNLAGPMLDALSEVSELERDVLTLATRLGWLDG